MRMPMLVAALAAMLPAPAPARIEASPAAVLAGRVAGAPRECLPGFQRDRESRTYGSGDILFRGAGATWFLNRPEGCPRFRSQMTLVTVTPGQLCRGDIVRLVDPVAGLEFGACPLGAFVPYDRPRR